MGVGEVGSSVAKTAFVFVLDSYGEFEDEDEDDVLFRDLSFCEF